MISTTTILMVVVTMATLVAAASTMNEKKDSSTDHSFCIDGEFWNKDAGACVPCKTCSAYSAIIIKCSHEYDTICVKDFTFSNHMMDNYVHISTETPPQSEISESEPRFYSNDLVVGLFAIPASVLIVSIVVLLYQLRKLQRKRMCTYGSLTAPVIRESDEECPRYTQDPTSLVKPNSQRVCYSSTSAVTDNLQLDAQTTSGGAVGPVLWFPSRDLEMYESDSDLTGQSSTGSGSGEYVYIKKVPPGSIDEPDPV